MNLSEIRVSRVLAMAILFTCLGYMGFRSMQHTEWYQARLYERLLHGDAGQRLAASMDLARLRSEKFLLQGLKSSETAVRESSRRALESVWFTAAGGRAFDRLVQAHEAMGREEMEVALEMLDALIEDYPDFAEAWNRRASLYWKMEDYERSMADCRQALRLNPVHYGAWQGFGICQLNLGDIAGACQSLRSALRILPYDASTRDSLRQCEELLRMYPHVDEVPRMSYDLI